MPKEEEMIVELKNKLAQPQTHKFDGLMQEFMILGILSHPNIRIGSTDSGFHAAFAQLNDPQASRVSQEGAVRSILEKFKFSDHVMSHLNWNVLLSEQVMGGIRKSLGENALLTEPDYTGSACLDAAIHLVELAKMHEQAVS